MRAERRQETADRERRVTQWSSDLVAKWGRRAEDSRQETADRKQG